ncbi:MAG: fasciclin domain-containing protein [Myxococcales bacterium]|jgi:uncharacterized surface protein with fasciclin (FAS1) repeats|nr:fasciclin domain-containing protein [Myxococcales bacterium]
MKRLIPLLLVLTFAGCEKEGGTAQPAPAKSGGAAPTQAAPNPPPARQAGLNTVVDVALGSKDHSTLVAALKGAEYVDSLDNAGPFTVFAPTNAAFDKLPAGTVDGLMKPDKKDDLRNVLKYHVTVSMYQPKDLKDGQVLGMANGGKVTVHVKDGKIKVNDANVVATVTATNGVVHVVDAVLLPPAK